MDDIHAAACSKHIEELATTTPKLVVYARADAADPDIVGALGARLDSALVIETEPRCLVPELQPGHENIIFFWNGDIVYTMSSKDSIEHIIQRGMLFNNNPDTLRQLARQESVAYRQNLDRQQQQQVSSTVLHSDGSSSMLDASMLGDVTPALKIFISGDRSHVGKSSVCLGLLGSLLKLGYSAADLAYIKPATQCEQPQLVSQWCEEQGIACKGIGPIVFYTGFTREFLKGNAGTSQQLLQDAKTAVDELSIGKRVMIVDGVGYPAVGSICGVSNAHIARALNIPVVLVGKSGVGDAVDSYNLNACFFEAHGVRVLGGIFNKLPLDGYYSLHNCKQAVEQYFTNLNKGLPYGFIPTVTPAADEKLSAQMLIDACASNVDVSRLLADVNEALLPETPNDVPRAVSAASSRSSSTTPTLPEATQQQQQQQTEQLPTKCRETIEQEAYESGATTG